LKDEEAEALASLRGGKMDWVELPNEPDGLRLIAPILAGETCLKCHEGEAGSVLGAFDYIFKCFRE